MGKVDTSLLLHRSVVLSTSLKTLYKNPKKKKKKIKKKVEQQKKQRENDEAAQSGTTNMLNDLSDTTASHLLKLNPNAHPMARPIPCTFVYELEHNKAAAQ